MDMGRESRWDKDAMTVEIAFALVTAAVLGAAVFAVAFGVAVMVGLGEPAGNGLLTTGGVAGFVAAVWRVVRVLHRFDAQRRSGT